MKKIILILTVVLFASCDNKDKHIDFVLDENTGDTVRVNKHYPSGKLKEFVLYENNHPSRSFGFSEKGDTLDIPRAIYVKANQTIFVYIPIPHLYSDVQVLFENTGTADKNFDATLTVKTIGSVDIPIVDRMIKDKQINGFIKTTAADKKSVDMWPFKIITDH